MWFFCSQFYFVWNIKIKPASPFSRWNSIFKVFFFFYKPSKMLKFDYLSFFHQFWHIIIIELKNLWNTFLQKCLSVDSSKLFLSRPMDINSTGQQPNFLWHIGCCCCCEVVVVVVVAGEGEDEDWIISLIPKGRTLFHSTRATEEMVEDQFNTC